MVRKVRGLGVDVPDHRRLPLQRAQAAVEYRRLARAAKYRHQPRQRRGEAARRALRDDRQGRGRQRKPVRIGVNWGSLDQAILTELMDANATLASRVTRAT
jgi:(E)-4-hydroxy-3-methylbut-2-enyl-diphosphate synthase